jgi:hypothetical protein
MSKEHRMGSLLRLFASKASKPGCPHDTVTLHTKVREYNHKHGASDTIIVGVCNDCGFSDLRFNLGQIVNEDAVIGNIKKVVLEASGYRSAGQGTWTRTPPSE